MAWFKCSGGGIPALLKNRMNNVLNKKFGTSTTYPPDGWPDTVNLMGMLEEKTVSGSVVAFSDGADAVKLKSCAVTIAPNLDGVSSVDVVHTGKNLFNLIPYLATAQNTPTFSDCMCVKSGTYTFSFDKISNGETDATSWRYCITVYNTEGQLVTDWTLSPGLPYRAALYSYVNGTNTSIKSTTFNLQGDCYIFIRFWYGDTTADMDMISPMLELGNTATSFEPYSGTTHTANLGRTIYGGEVDVVNGAGTENYKVIRLDSLPFIKNNNQTNPNGTYFSLDGVVVPFIGWGYGYGGRDTAMSNVLDKGSISATGSSEPNNTFWWNNASTGWRVIWGEPNGGSSLEDFMAFLTANNVVVGGTLATPEDFTFTAVPIISRLGDNTMWSDDGDLSVIYRSSGTQTLIPPTLISKTVTANGTYSAEDDNADGYDEVTVNVSGGGGNTPQATQTLICDNSALGSTLTFTDDYENYDLIKFVVYRSDVQNTFVFYATPAMINACWQYSSNRINFNQPYGNNFVCYTKTSNTSWSRYGVRNLAVQYVYGLTFTNCTVAETELYNRQGIGSSAVTFTPPTGESFLDYDYILLATCTGNSDETQVNLEVFQPDIEKDIFGSDNADENSVRVYKYNQGGTFVTVTENTITAFSYFYACGLKLSYNQQNLLGGFNSNSEQGEQENEIENELNELEQEETPEEVDQDESNE